MAKKDCVKHADGLLPSPTRSGPYHSPMGCGPSRSLRGYLFQSCRCTVFQATRVGIVSSLICAKPPSTKSSAQLTKLLSSEARNTTAFATTYGSVRSILDNKIDRQTAQQPPTNGVPILHPNIRGPRYYH